MFNRKQRFALAALTAAALLLSGCAGTGSPAPTSTEGTGGPVTGPVDGGTLTALLLSEPRNLDPHGLQNNNRAQALVGNALYGTLFTADPDSAELIPSLAESLTTSDGGTTFELKLREGLTFTDGTPFDAAAVEYHWSYAQDPENGSNGLQDSGLIVDMNVVDDVTLEFTLERETPRFGARITLSPLNWIASPTAHEAGAEAFDANPVGAGPFVLDNWTRGGTLSLLRNDDYALDAAHLDGIDVQFVADTNQRLNALATGAADITMIDNWGITARAEEAGLQVVEMPISGGQLLAMNQTAAPFDDIRARQAIAHGLNLEAFNQIINEGQGTLATYLFSDDHPLFNDVALTEYDPERAQELLDELAADGKPLSVTFTTFQGSEVVGEAYQSLLSSYDNLTVEIEVVSWAETGRVLGQKQYQTTIAATSFQEPDTALPRAYLGGAPRNSVGVNDAELDRALIDGTNATETAARQEAYQRFSTRFAELAVGIYYQREPLVAVASDKVGGIQMYAQGSLIPDTLWLAE